MTQEAVTSAPGVLKRRKTKEGPDDRDKVIGQRLRARRNFLGLSQEKIGKAVGLTFQQVQKYEHGSNKISAVRLVDFCDVLNVSINYFYAGLTDIGEKTPKLLNVSDNAQETLDGDPLARKETVELLKYYYQIEDEKLRKSVLKLVRQMAENG